MDKPTPTRQQREILAGLGQTLGSFSPAQTPYPDQRPAEPPARRRNPRALIVAASRIKVDQDQVRQADRGPESERIRELAKSIQAVGLQQPPGVRETTDGQYEIVYGEGRFTAMTQVLGWTEIEVMRVDVSDDDLIWHQLHENLHRTNLSPLDLAAAVKQAMEKYSLAQVAERMGKSETWVQKALTVGTRLGEEAWATLAAAPERPAIDTVYAIAQVPAEAQAAVAKEVVEKKLTRAAAVELAGAAKEGRTDDAAPKRSGRKKGKGKPFETTLKAKGGTSVTVRFRKAEVVPEEVAAALEEVLVALRLGKGKSAA